MTSMRRRAVALGFAITFVSVPARAFAASSAEDQAAAEALFEEGKALVKARSYVAGCAKFEESQRLDPRASTLFRLADCRERAGRTASAWVDFLNVAAAMSAAHDAPREQAARDRAAALEPKLSRLTVRVTAPAPGIVVRRDGSEIGPAQWNTAVPVDPGSHVVQASAPGRVTWEMSASVAVSEPPVVVTVPELALEPIAALVPALPPPQEVPRLGTRRVSGIVIASLGLASVAVGSAFGLLAKGKLADAQPYCPNPSLCLAPGITFTNEARTDATVSTATFIAGGAAIVAGVLVAALPSRPSRGAAPPSGLRLQPLVDHHTAGGALGGSW